MLLSHIPGFSIFAFKTFVCDFAAFISNPHTKFSSIYHGMTAPYTYHTHYTPHPVTTVLYTTSVSITNPVLTAHATLTGIPQPMLSRSRHMLHSLVFCANAQSLRHMLHSLYSQPMLSPLCHMLHHWYSSANDQSLTLHSLYSQPMLSRLRHMLLTGISQPC